MPTPTPTPTPTGAPTVTPAPVVTPTPMAVSIPRQGTLGGNPMLPNTSTDDDQTGGWLVAAGAAVLLGVTQLVWKRRVRGRSRSGGQT